MESKVSVDKLAAELRLQLQNFGDAIKEDINAATDKAANALRATLRSTSPVRTGGYKSKWQIKNTGEGLVYQRTVHNAKKYQISHILENGRSGGIGRRIHIAPARQDALDQFYQECLTIIQRQGGV